MEVDQVTENLKHNVKESEFILEASDTEVFLEQSNMVLSCRKLIWQLIGMRLEEIQLTSILHVLDDEN